MIADDMAFINYISRYFGVFQNIIPYTKKCCLGFKIIQYIQDVIRKVWNWPIIEGEINIFVDGWNVPHQIAGYFF